MSQRYFADTWYLVALIKRDDSNHATARRIAISLAGQQVVTTDAVLIELLNYVCEAGPTLRDRAGEFVGVALDGGADIEVLEQNRELLRRALARYRQRADKGYSLVDCMSMCVMETREITYAITDDRHFEQERFVVIRGPLEDA